MNESLFDEAQRIINGQRNQDYGNVHESFTRIASFWTDYLNHQVTIFDVAMMMVLLKISRLRNNPLHRDSACDIVGYMGCYEKLLSAPSKKMDKLNQD